MVSRLDDPSSLHCRHPYGYALPAAEWRFRIGGGQFWASVAFLSLLCTIAAFYVQNAAIRGSTPTRVGLLMGTEPLFGLLFAAVIVS
uniref:DMT family transporter n=1 Tax=Microvirga yunnanensis TaxID=2953740 RepID=UPI0021C6227F|nr:MULTISPECIES: DMT family transporter [unclassified Microvirga]